MRIVHVVHQFGPEFVGGTELYTAMVARYQAAAGHEVTVFVPSVTAAESVEDGVRIWRVPLGERSAGAVLQDSVWGEARLLQAWPMLLNEQRPDVVHIEHLLGLPAKLPQLLIERQIPYVLTLHDYWYGCANAQLLTNDRQALCAGPEMFINCGRCALARAGIPALWTAPVVAPLFAYRQRLLRQVWAGAAQIIAPAVFVRQAYAQMGFDVEKVEVIPHGIELPERLPAKPAVRREPGLDAVYVGGIAPQKGLHILVDAFTGLPHEEATLTIYGDLDAFPEYVAALRQKATHPGIRFAGRVSRTDVWRVLAEADITAVPTQWYEAFGLVVSESFAVGTPVLASDMGVIGERVRHGVDGWLVPHDSVPAWCTALNKLYYEPELQRHLQAQIPAVKRAAAHVAELLALYQKVGRGV